MYIKHNREIIEADFYTTKVQHTICNTNEIVFPHTVKSHEALFENIAASETKAVNLEWSLNIDWITLFDSTSSNFMNMKRKESFLTFLLTTQK